ncbi:MAG: UDP-4-amino-4,6-dideoxy-N-acetyl-beta-L-altrosamine N-acetyltransferase [Caulobacterales bacterium]|uniref:UDP-4-amino-4, 6-dideoxy-N-acetyl-beta-L-altrosamine N-acetyltransferase n=1 Tax=Glycocaulis sp. TaxID=1969725 RepID=UPI003F9EF1A8
MSVAEPVVSIGRAGWLRPMTDGDLAQVLAWRNAPAVRANMYTTHEISPDEHERWWSVTRGDASRRYFLFEDAAGAFGVVGFTRIGETEGEAEWAFYASGDAPPGTGSRMEWLALEYAFSTLQLDTLRCEVLEQNARVIALHERFGFHRVEKTTRLVDGTREAIIYRLALDQPGWAKFRQSAFDRITARQAPSS